MGTIIREDEPNYALLLKAIQTTKMILGFINFSGRSVTPDTSVHASQGPDDLASHLDIDTLEFEFDFWQNLEDYSSALDI